MGLKLVTSLIGIALIWGHPSASDWVNTGVRTKCAWTREYIPVCGTDNRTYGNAGQLACAAQKPGNNDLRVKYKGRCRPDESWSPNQKVVPGQPAKGSSACRNPIDHYDPVCGSDGKTYSNPGLLACAAERQPSLGLKEEYKGRCRSSGRPISGTISRLAACLRAVSNKYDPVCGSDGKTYSNSELLACEIQRNPSLKESHRGSCRSFYQTSTSTPTRIEPWSNTWRPYMARPPPSSNNWKWPRPTTDVLDDDNDYDNSDDEEYRYKKRKNSNPYFQKFTKENVKRLYPLNQYDNNLLESNEENHMSV